MATVDHVELNFDELFTKQIGARLLDDSAGYLAFIAMFSGMEGLACFYHGIQRDKKGRIDWENGPTFRTFIVDFFPAAYHSLDLWGLRNSLIHRFVPDATFHLRTQDPAMHLQIVDRRRCLVAGCLFEDFKKAASAYFQKVRSDAATSQNFRKVCDDLGILDANHVLSHSANHGTATQTTVDFVP